MVSPAHTVRLVSITLVLFCAGCQGLDLGAGVVVRPVRGRWGIIRETARIPLVRLQARMPWEEGLDAYVRFDVVNGHKSLTDGGIDRIARGDMQVLGGGVLIELIEGLHLDVGAEAYHADFAVVTSAGSPAVRISDSVVGWAANLGLALDLPLTQRVALTLGATYGVGQNWSRWTDLDFDGLAWSGLLRVTLD